MQTGNWLSAENCPRLPAHGIAVCCRTTGSFGSRLESRSTGAAARAETTHNGEPCMGPGHVSARAGPPDGEEFLISSPSAQGPTAASSTTIGPCALSGRRDERSEAARDPRRRRKSGRTSTEVVVFDRLVTDELRSRLAATAGCPLELRRSAPPNEDRTCPAVPNQTYCCECHRRIVVGLSHAASLRTGAHNPSNPSPRKASGDHAGRPRLDSFGSLGVFI